MSNRRRTITGSGVRIEQIKDLPLGSKIMLSSGKTFLVQAKNVSGHQSNSVTLVSEFVTESYTWAVSWHSAYEYSDIHKSIMPKYYNELNQTEKNAIIERSFEVGKELDGYGTPGVYFAKLSSHFWAPSGKELGLSTGKGANLGFTDNASRKKTLKNSVASGYYTTSSYYYQYRNLDDNEYYVYVISSNGIEEKPKVIASSKRLTGFETGVLPCCDVKGDSILRYKSGYWRFE